MNYAASPMALHQRIYTLGQFSNGDGMEINLANVKGLLAILERLI